MERTPIHTLTGLSLRLRLGTDEDSTATGFNIRPGDVVLCRVDTGEVVASVDPEDIFDRNGNRFAF